MKDKCDELDEDLKKVIEELEIVLLF